MRRRTLGTGNVAPIRMVNGSLNLPELKQSRHSVSRQLTFNVSSEKNVIDSQLTNNGSHVKVQEFKPNESLMDGSSIALGQSFAAKAPEGESSMMPNLPSINIILPPESSSETMENPHASVGTLQPRVPACTGNESKTSSASKSGNASQPAHAPKLASAFKSASVQKRGNGSQGVTVSKLGSASKCADGKRGNGRQGVTVSKLGSASKSASMRSSHTLKPSCVSKLGGAVKFGSQKKQASATPSETRIPRPKLSSGGQASLNSTAIFEEAEIAALVATPHIKTKNQSGPSSMDSNYLAEQISLLILDQRSLLQGLKLTLSKMDTVMDTLKDVNVNLKQLLQSGNVEGGQKSENVTFVGADSTLNVNGNASANIKPAAKPRLRRNHQVLSPTIESEDENKENSVKPLRKSICMYREIKSEASFLKTPSESGTERPRTADTPNTVLSNTICNQLENLFESSD